MSMPSPLLTPGGQDGTLDGLGVLDTKDSVMHRRTTKDVVTPPPGDNVTDIPIVIDAHNEARMAKPTLTPAQDFLATEPQRARIVNDALDDLLDTQGNHLDWGSLERLRDELKCRTGVNDAAVSLVLFMRLRSLDVRTW